MYIKLQTTIMVLLMTNVNTVAADSINELRTAREVYIEHFRIHGERDIEQARLIENKLNTLMKNTNGKSYVQTLFELATIQRINNQFEQAIENYERAVAAAEKLEDSSLAFDAWLGIARSHAYGTRDHGAAATAFERAIDSAGTTPTKKQAYEIADYSSQLQVGRGDLESALLNGLSAIQLAQDDSERFYAFLDTGDVLQKYAESCDYRKLIDAKSTSETDSWGACKRAVGAAETYYVKAKGMANNLGWKYLENQTGDFINQLSMRLHIINSKASFEKLGQAAVFNAQHVDDVLINENFSSGGSELSEGFPLGPIIEEVTSESPANDPRSIYLKGIKADLDKKPEEALEYFKRAASLLSIEHSSLFDIRQRGTVLENRPELVRDLGLRLLSFKQYDEAFMVFESIRSRGLGGLASAFKENYFSKTERQLIAGLVQLDSAAGATQAILVEAVIAGIDHKALLELFNKLSKINQQRREYQQQKQLQSVRKKLTSVEYNIPSMTQLQKAVNQKTIPVLLYWVTTTNVVVWVISPQGVDVKTVFLPEVAVIDKVSKLLDTVKSNKPTFDDKTSKELYAYLIKPFAKYLTQKQVMIIPQGALVGLPFEALIDGESGKYLAETLAVSYAPNAAFALQILEQGITDISNITALYDEEIDKRTQEISQLKNLKNVRLSAHPSEKMTSTDIINYLGPAQNVHVLLHGVYNFNDPLQSIVATSEGPPNYVPVTAAELLAVDWHDTQLAVFSSCEGALVKTRISNEQFGISWALLAGGVDNVVLSRWRVNGVSNALWMETFYQTMLKGASSPALAANTAMRRMINSDKRHPFYWAGPQVFGR